MLSSCISHNNEQQYSAAKIFSKTRCKSIPANLIHHSSYAVYRSSFFLSQAHAIKYLFDFKSSPHNQVLKACYLLKRKLFSKVLRAPRPSLDFLQGPLLAIQHESVQSNYSLSWGGERVFNIRLYPPETCPKNAQLWIDKGITG
ncbi:hypothetical protein AVEN_174770-1 [Araneus ventricosus]|uniref:Uncharacterized protein n=1 Tax=Araneus ventricosus TaxID=182803 RepID=A0A4Y2BJR8_ARAVE|nr:hypothetical protein AVEN_174770-1 [Araneus ventricosus]